MQLDSITPEKSRQWLKAALISGLFVFIAIGAGTVVFYVLKNNQEKSGLYFVDAKYQGFLEWGSEKHPYKNINKAFQTVSCKKISSPIVHIKNGEYNERIEIAENAKVFGESRSGVVLKSDHSLPIVVMKNNSSVASITTAGGSVGILSEGQANIENCAVTEFKEKGIGAAPSDSEITITNSEIFGGSNKGVYIQRGRKINISGNKVYNNKGEGLDIRDNVSGVISNNELYNNSESGIEFIVGGSVLDIRENNIWDNGSSGIVCQYYEESPEKGSIIIHANHIKALDSEKYTISVKSPSGGEGRVKNYWRDSVTIAKDNVLEGEIKTRSLEISKK